VRTSRRVGRAAGPFRHRVGRLTVESKGSEGGYGVRWLLGAPRLPGRWPVSLVQIEAPRTSYRSLHTKKYGLADRNWRVSIEYQMLMCQCRRVFNEETVESRDPCMCVDDECSSVDIALTELI